MEQAKYLGEEKISKLLLKFSIPSMVGMIVNALYNIVDSIFVGNGVGEMALAAVAIAFPIMIVLMGFGMLIGVGAGSLVSIRMGEKRKEDAEKILGNAFTLLLGASVGLSAVMLLFLDPLLIFLGADPHTTLPYARDFTRVILCGSVFMHIGFGTNSIVRAQGDPKTAMATMLISAVINTILNPIFIFYFQWGISGSALATVLAQSVSCAWVLHYFFSTRSYLKIRLPNMRLDRQVVAEIIEVGMSPFLMQIAASVVGVLFNYSLVRYGGELAVASVGIINRVAMLLLMPIFGLSQGVQPIIGYNYGAKQYKRVVEAVKIGILAATAFSVVSFGIVQLFSSQIVALFNQNPELVAMGSHGLRLFLMMLPVIGLQVISANYFQAVGKSKYAIWLSMSRQVILLIPLLLLLPGWLGLDGAWLAAPVADLGSALLTSSFLVSEFRKFQLDEV